MKLPRVNTAILLMMAWWPAFVAAAPFERNVEKTFEGAGVLKLRSDHGPITVKVSDGSTLKVRVRLIASSDDEAAANRQFQEVTTSFAQVAESASVAVKQRRQVRWSWEAWPPVGVAIEVLAPRSCSVDVETHSGAIEIGSLKGKVRAHSGGGSIFIGEIDGDVEATCQRGDVAVTACTGRLTLSARNGNVAVGRSLGPASLTGTGGTLEIQSARGPVEARGDGADVRIGFAHPMTSPAELSAAGGDIIVTMDDRSDCTIAAQASVFGSVKTRELPVHVAEGGVGESRLIAQLNRGGPRITLRSSGGSIRLQGVPSLP